MNPTTLYFATEDARDKFMGKLILTAPDTLMECWQCGDQFALDLPGKGL